MKQSISIIKGGCLRGSMSFIELSTLLGLKKNYEFVVFC